MKRVLLLTGLSLLFSAHELFLKTDSYYLKPNSSSELYLFNGTFDESENVISRDRITKAKIIGPEYNSNPDKSAYYDNGDVTYLRFKSGREGTYVAGISTLPNMIKLTAEEFKEYLEHEGLADMIAEREKKGTAHLSANEKYSKHVKALLQVGDKPTQHFATELGYPIEFIPLNNPYDLQEGDQISFRLLSKGSPLSNQVVHYSFRSETQNTTAEENSTRTDNNGVLTINLSDAGKWYVATIHMVESEEEGIDYESNWATLTFEIK